MGKSTISMAMASTVNCYQMIYSPWWFHKIPWNHHFSYGVSYGFTHFMVTTNTSHPSAAPWRPAVAAGRAPQPDPAGTHARCRWWQPLSPQEMKIIQEMQDSMKYVCMYGCIYTYVYIYIYIYYIYISMFGPSILGYPAAMLFSLKYWTKHDETRLKHAFW